MIRRARSGGSVEVSALALKDSVGLVHFFDFVPLFHSFTSLPLRSSHSTLFVSFSRDHGNFLLSKACAVW